MSIYLHLPSHALLLFFFFNDPATTEIYTLSLHDALPIYSSAWRRHGDGGCRAGSTSTVRVTPSRRRTTRSEEHTSELQSHVNLVCRLLLEKKKKKKFHSPSQFCYCEWG